MIGWWNGFWNLLIFFKKGIVNNFVGIEIIKRIFNNLLGVFLMVLVFVGLLIVFVVWLW